MTVCVCVEHLHTHDLLNTSMCELELQSQIRKLFSLKSFFQKPDKSIDKFSYLEMSLISFSRVIPLEVEFCGMEKPTHV